MWRYADFLRIRHDFADVFSQEEDAKRPDAWRYFLPHQAFRELLNSFIRAGLRESRVKPVWISGPYGTGKTYACFVLKHLLEDSKEKVQEYLSSYQLIKNLTDDFLNLRNKGKWIVPYLSSASFATTSKVFLSSVQEGIKTSLIKQGLNVPQTHVGKVCQYLEEHPNLFEDIFAKYRYQYFASYKTKDQIIDDLKRKNSLESISLAENICSALEKESVLLHDTPEDLKRWIKEVIEENNLAGILFIWDEFTDFFRPGAPVDVFQEMAHAAEEIPFYLLPVTHVSPDLVKKRAALEEQTAKKIFDRFKIVRFELQPVTAYELIAGAIEEIPEKEKDWQEQKDLLSFEISETVTDLIANEEGVHKEHLERLIPIHPYSAFLLAQIAKNLTSSQRSLFKFIKDKEKGFAAFIEQFPQDEDGPFWLLADKLWDYFFSEGVPEEFPDESRTIVSFVSSRIDSIPYEETKKVFKVIMLLRLLYNLNPIPLLMPHRKNLKLALNREIIEHLAEHINYLKNEGHVNIVSRGYSNEEYLLPLGYSHEELKIFIEKIKQDNPFKDFVKEELFNSFKENFNIPGYLQPRFVLKVISHEDFRSELRNIEKNSEPYQIPVIAIVSGSEEERQKAINECKKIASNLEQIIFLVLDPPFEKEEKFNRWIEHKAKEKYAKEKGDFKNEQFHKREAENVIKEWLESLSYRDFLAFWKHREESLRYQAFKDFYKEVCQNIFPYGPESICNSPNTLFQRNDIKPPIQMALGLKKITKQYETFISKLKKEEIPVLKGKEKIKESFKDGRLNISKLWEEFKKSPFGLNPSLAGKAFFTYLLKDYATPEYYLYDGIAGHPLSPEGLRDLLEKLFKGKQTDKYFYICVKSPETQELIQDLKMAFKLSDEKIEYLEQLRNKIREQVKILDYPLFSFKYLDDITSSWNDNLKGYWKIYIDCIRKWLESEEQISDIKQMNFKLNQEFNLDRDIREILGLIYYINRNFNFHDKLGFIFNGNYAEKGFKNFIKSKKPVLTNYLQKKNIETKNIMDQLKHLLPEELYCWTENKTIFLLDEIFNELKIAEHIKLLTNYYDTDIYHTLICKFKEDYLKKRIKVNLFLLASIIESQSLKDTMKKLARLALNEISPEEKESLVENLEKNISELKKAFLEAKNHLTSWLKEKHKIELTETEIEEILDKISENVLDKDITKIEKTILEISNKFDRIKAYRKLKQKWEELTNSSSPAEWSKTKNIPIEWIIEGKEFDQLFNLLNSDKHQGTVEEYKKYTKFLETKKEELQKIKDPEKTNRIFLRKLLNIEYDQKMIENSFVEQLKKHLVKNLNIPIHEWKYNEEKIKELAHDFLNKNYNNHIKWKIISRVERLSEKEAKIILNKIADDPQIGLKLIKWIGIQ